MRHSACVIRQASGVTLGWRGAVVAILLALLLAGIGGLLLAGSLGTGSRVVADVEGGTVILEAEPVPGG